MNKTRVARSILRVLNDAHMPINRQEIARGMGKRYLMRHDIKTLNRLLDIDLVAGYKRVRWEVMDERFAGRYAAGRPDISKDISNGSVSWWYEITDAGSQVIQQADRWMERPATIPRQPTSQSDRATNPGNQPRSQTGKSNKFEFDFDLNDIPDDQSNLDDIPDDQTDLPDSPGESIIERVAGLLDRFLNLK